MKFGKFRMNFGTVYKFGHLDMSGSSVFPDLALLVLV